MQQWFNLSDPCVVRRCMSLRSCDGFLGVGLGFAPAPDETTVCRFRYLLEHDLGDPDAGSGQCATGSERVSALLPKVVDAALLHTLSSMRNASGQRDLKVHQMRRAKWYFGLKTHIGMNSNKALFTRCARPEPPLPITSSAWRKKNKDVER